MQIRLRLAPVLTPCLSQFLLAEAFGGINSEIHRCRPSRSDRRMQIRLRLAHVFTPCPFAISPRRGFRRYKFRNTALSAESLRSPYANTASPCSRPYALSFAISPRRGFRRCKLRIPRCRISISRTRSVHTRDARIQKSRGCPNGARLGLLYLNFIPSFSSQDPQRCSQRRRSQGWRNLR